MYVAENNYVYYCNPNEISGRELFITVHPTKDCTKTPSEQAVLLADMLNDVTTRT
jgi:hypothetical protein